MTNDVRRRLGKLLAVPRLRTLDPDRPYEEVVDTVAAALPAGAGPVLVAIGDQVDASHARPPVELPDFGPSVELHGFTQWLLGVSMGWCPLPAAIPLRVLAAYRDGHARHPAGGTCGPGWRCGGCRMALPDGPHGVAVPWPRCPVCKSSKVAKDPVPDWLRYTDPDAVRAGTGS